MRLAQALPTGSPKLDSRGTVPGHAAAIEPPGHLGPQLDGHCGSLGGMTTPRWKSGGIAFVE